MAQFQSRWPDRLVSQEGRADIPTMAESTVGLKPTYQLCLNLRGTVVHLTAPSCLNPCSSGNHHQPEDKFNELPAFRKQRPARL